MKNMHYDFTFLLHSSSGELYKNRLALIKVSAPKNENKNTRNQACCKHHFFEEIIKKINEMNHVGSVFFYGKCHFCAKKLVFSLFFSYFCGIYKISFKLLKNYLDFFRQICYIIYIRNLYALIMSK